MNDLGELVRKNEEQFKHTLLDTDQDEQKTAMKNMATKIMNKKDSPI